MKQIDMIKAFAKLEGVELSCDANDLTGNYETVSAPYMSYNPITDLALNCAARDKYEIYIDYQNKMVLDYLPDFQESYLAIGYGCMILNRSVSYAIIECILKSKGLWHE